VWPFQPITANSKQGRATGPWLILADTKQQQKECFVRSGTDIRFVAFKTSVIAKKNLFSHGKQMV
jgi:hypothetical protein